MALIRDAAARTLSRDAVVLDLGDLTRQAEQIKARATAEAERIVAEARAERERIVAGAVEAGHAEGLARGLEEGREQGLAAGRQEATAELAPQLRALEAAWNAALEVFENRREEMLAAARHDVLQLAIRIGEMVTKRAINVDPAVVVDQLEAVLLLIVRPTRLVVGAHPDDVALLRDALPALSARFEAARHIELAPDEHMERGSCIARTLPVTADGSSASAGGEIDASVGTQLERIVEALIPSAGGETGAGEGDADDGTVL